MNVISDIKHINTENDSVITVDVIKYGLPTGKNRKLISDSTGYGIINDTIFMVIRVRKRFCIITHIIIDSPEHTFGFVSINRIIVSKISIMKGIHIYPCLLLPSLLGAKHFNLSVDARITALSIKGSLSNFTLFTDFIQVKPNYFSPIIIYPSPQWTLCDMIYQVEYVNPPNVLSKMKKEFDRSNINNYFKQHFLTSDFSLYIGYDIVSGLIDEAKMDGILIIIRRIVYCAFKMKIVLVKDILDCIVSFLRRCL